MITSTALIDAAMASAATAAAALGNAVVPIPPSTVGGVTDGSTQTVQTDVLQHGSVIGYKITGTITLGPFRVTRIIETLPVARTTIWPANFTTAAATAATVRVQNALRSAESYLTSLGFTAHLIQGIVLDYTATLSAAGGSIEPATASRPMLIATMVWLQSVKTAAASGSTAFAPPPYTSVEVAQESV